MLRSASEVASATVFHTETSLFSGSPGSDVKIGLPLVSSHDHKGGHSRTYNEACAKARPAIIGGGRVIRPGLSVSGAETAEKRPLGE